MNDLPSDLYRYAMESQWPDRLCNELGFWASDTGCYWTNGTWSVDVYWQRNEKLCIKTRKKGWHLDNTRIECEINEVVLLVGRVRQRIHECPDDDPIQICMWAQNNRTIERHDYKSLLFGMIYGSRLEGMDLTVELGIQPAPTPEHIVLNHVIGPNGVE